MDINIQHHLTIFGVNGGEYEYGIKLDGDGMVELSYSEPDRPEVASTLTIAPDDLPTFIKALTAFAELNNFTGEE